MIYLSSSGYPDRYVTFDNNTFELIQQVILGISIHDCQLLKYMLSSPSLGIFPFIGSKATANNLDANTGGGI
jgi:hypothetical protein